MLGRLLVRPVRAPDDRLERPPRGDGEQVEVTCDGRTVGKGIVGYSSGELRRIKGLKTDAVRELLPRATEEAVHRDYFVLD